MDDSVGINISISIEDLIHEDNGFCLGDSLFGGDELGQITAIAQFSDDVGIIFGVIDVIEFDDILAIFQSFEYFYFRSE